MTICYVIGSGPSLTGFDFDRLPPGYRIGANKSGWLANCDTLVTLDRHFPRKCKRELREYKGEIVIAVSKDHRYEDCHIPHATYLNHHRGEFLHTDPGTLNGLDSGFAALNLAFQRGFKEIALLGFDFKWNGDQTHFHDGYATMNRQTPRMLERWARNFDRVVGQLTDAGVCVTNFVGPMGSNVTAFPTRPLDDIV